MPWYKVIKTIRGRGYLYWQMTYREKGKVKTRNKYIGPANSESEHVASSSPSIRKELEPLVAEPFPTSKVNAFVKTPLRQPASHPVTTTQPQSQYDPTVAEHRELLAKKQPRPQEPVHPERQRQWDEEEKDWQRGVERARRENEREAYGPRTARIRKMEAAQRKAKRNAKGTGATNAFLGQAIKRLKDK
jgi:hypothetical protein